METEEGKVPVFDRVESDVVDIAATESDAPPLQDDWQLERGLGDCLLVVFQQGLWTDVTFAFQEDDAIARVHAHKLVLASRSPVFQAMFYGPMSDSRHEIEITDVTADYFRLLLT
jgi:speckle-type POZ protein